MSNFEKPLKDFTDEELQNKIDTWDPRFGALGSYELLRRLSVENSVSSKRYARWSLVISIAAIVVSIVLASVQILVSAPYDETCTIMVTQDQKITDCQHSIKLNFLGTHEWNSHHIEINLSTTTYNPWQSGGPFDLLSTSSLLFKPLKK